LNKNNVKDFFKHYKKFKKGNAADYFKNFKKPEKRWHIINFLINQHNFNSYLEIGSHHKLTYDRIKIDYKKCVDPADFKNKKFIADYKLTSNDFFERNTKKFDIIFIDGLHLQEQIKLDIHNSLKILNKGGIIICHDINPETVESQKRNYIFPLEWNGDVWKEWIRLRTLKNLYMYVIDSDCGLGVIQKGKQTPVTLPEKIKFNLHTDEQFFWFLKNKKTALNLISFEDFVNSYNE
tara:strand:- start:253 stop:960 length:708 start_codon:yes stop_codon:yes gene_type:complete